MLSINVQVDLSGLKRKTGLVKEQVPFATALALTKTAQAVKEAERAAMRSSFEDVVAFTLNSMYVDRATKQELVATVGVKGGDTGAGAIKWLRPEVYGGERQRGLEALLNVIGLPPSGMYAVPGSAAKMTHGNRIDINWVRSLVSDIAEQGVNESRGIVTKSNTRRRKGPQLQYFVLLQKWGKLLPGIYGRRGRGAFPFIVFVRRPAYRAKFNFYEVAGSTARTVFPQEFMDAARRAMQTAR